MNDRVNQLQPPSQVGLDHDKEAFQDRNILTVYGRIEEAKVETEFCFPDGTILRVPTSILLEAASRQALSQTAEPPTQIETVVPVLEERLDVGRRTVETGKVRLEKHVHEYRETLNETLQVKIFDVERVPFQQVVDAPPPVRQEGDTTIYPVVEERLVLTKELVLREEVRVTQRDTESRDTRSVTLQRESVTISRIALDTDE